MMLCLWIYLEGLLSLKILSRTLGLLEVQGASPAKEAKRKLLILRVTMVSR
ncbi:hypothetical protein KC19_2G023600 [Ceratodon purpureus]|uniref:Uncharacterized protein n=1 Tax=Ceratodon purpureus TaxID=3225 RepID=A0A8T0IS17_CERPU|nr:hypothetical protein KC19_2G023600 [Ceratodon purpureus]